MKRFFRKAVKAVQLCRHACYRQGLRHFVGATIEHEAALKGLEVGTVIDVGSNKGQFSLLARKLYPNAQIHAFEPLSDQASIFKKIFTGDRNVSLHPVALGEENGLAEIHLSAKADSSSLLPILPRQDELFPGTKEIGIHEITVRRGDDLLAAVDFTSPLLIKLDVQGYEMAALKGMPELLSAASFVYAEVSFQELYSSQVLAGEMIAFMQSNGFLLAGIYNISNDSAFKPIQADALFLHKLTRA